MKVVVDRELCQGHSQCEHSAPEVFEVRDDGLAYVLREPDGPELLAKTRDASLRCPVDAISFVDE
jgi:ferredoxin